MAGFDDRKILIVDDDTRNIFALKAVLLSRGLECYTASSATEGFQQLAAHKDIGIVLLDMMMPEMDGYEMLAKFKKTRAKEIPVISVTAQAMLGDEEKCLDAGANAYISKPVDIDRLMELLNQFLL